MRFDKIIKISIDKLFLDENNYRLTKSEDQDHALLKIYQDSPDNFINMMTSIAEDDLGEPLLIYQDKDNKLIVADGNRRTAALKALKFPEKTNVKRIINKATQLNEQHDIKFDNILGQVSNNKDLIYKTIYERHAAGKGKSRISWAALGAARFRFEQSIDDGQEWYSIPLIFETESLHPKYSEYINSNKYSHETFRRIVNAAIKNGLIDSDLFNNNTMQINKKNNKRKWEKAISLTSCFIESMKNGELSLARGENYADKSNIDKYLDKFKYFKPHQPDLGLEHFELKPNDELATIITINENQTETSNTHLEITQIQAIPEEIQIINSNQTDGLILDQVEQNSETLPQEPTPEPISDIYTVKGKPQKPKGFTKIPSNDIITTALHTNKNFYKLAHLYYSICTISTEEHCALVTVGCWSFLETLTVILNKNDKESIVSFFNNKLNNDPIWKGKFKQYELKEFRSSIEYIHGNGNSTKHSKLDLSLDTDTLINKFRSIEPLIILALEQYKTNSSNNGD